MLRMDHVLIIGGTGMLAEATRWIARRARTTILIARTPGALAAEIGARPLPMDWTREESVRAALSAVAKESTPGLMVSWIHGAGLWCLPEFERLMAPGARSIRVHGSATGDPGGGVRTDPPPPQGLARQDIVLGWVSEPAGRRWLTHHEDQPGRDRGDRGSRPACPHRRRAALMPAPSRRRARGPASHMRRRLASPGAVPKNRNPS